MALALDVVDSLTCLQVFCVVLWCLPMVLLFTLSLAAGPNQSVSTSIQQQNPQQFSRFPRSRQAIASAQVLGKDSLACDHSLCP